MQHFLCFQDESSLMTDDIDEWGPELIFMWIVSPGLCIVGLLGNALTLIVLSSRLKDGVEIIEKGSLAGMIALAISDFFFCCITIFEVFLLDDSLIHESWSMPLFVTMYSKYFQNLFIKVSTHITVVMAVYRYFALVYPVQACKYMNRIILYKLVAIITGIIFWLLFFLPLLWVWGTTEVVCGADKLFIILSQGTYMENKLLYRAMNYSWNIVGFVLPLCILLFCNAAIIRALRRTKRKTRSQSQSFRNQRQNNQRRTSITLVSIVVCFCVLVSPSESLDFYLSIVAKSTRKWRILVIISNVLLTVNMSFNFALYCIVNSQFRKTIPVLYCIISNHIRKIIRRICNLLPCKQSDKKAMYALQSISET